MQSAATYSASNPTVIPDGGLATFLTATEGRWAQDNPWAEEYDYIGPSQGIGSVKQVADKIAEFGRNEDTYIVHAAHGETVVPMEVLDADPRLKARLFGQMKDMGIEPERYIVGSELNSINPVTGQPEFFIKKLASKVWSTVKTVFRTAAQIVLPIIGYSIGGPLGSALGSYAGTLIAGGNSAQALKAAKIAGITSGIGGIVKGGSEAIKAAEAAQKTGEALSLADKLNVGIQGGIKTLGQGLGLAEGPNYLQQLTEGVGGFMGAKPADKFLSLNPFETGRNIEARRIAGAEAADKYAAAKKAGEGFRLLPQDTGYVDPNQQQFLSMEISGADRGLEGNVLEVGKDGKLRTSQQTMGMTRGAPRGGVTTEAFDPENWADKQRQRVGQTFFERLKGPDEVWFGKDRDLLSNAWKILTGGRDIMPDRADLQRLKESAWFTAQKKADQAAVLKELTPSLLQKWGPAALATLGLASMQEAEQPEMPQIPTGWDLYAQNPGMYGIQQPNFGYGASFAPAQGRGQMAGMAPPPTFAEGGGMYADFPRRDGPIYGPGTETSDDIPAMLSDGEFVMTARAVRGAGGGDRERGMQRMYNIMNAFEGGAV